jgi:hypothetical protein
MIIKKNIFVFIPLLYFSLIAGFYYGEDSLGAAYYDYEALEHLNEKFNNNFLFNLLNYNDFGHRQSPFLYILSSIIFDLGETFRRIFFLHVYLLIPIYFYKCLKLKFKGVSKDYLKLFASIILLFPTFRSYSIWTDPHLLGTLFFIISIFYYLKVIKNVKSFKNALLNTFFLALAAYSSPNFGVFVIFFYFEYSKKFLLSKKIIIISLLNLVLSAPFFIYLFYLDVNFVFNNKSYYNLSYKELSLENLSNKIIIIISIFLFYLIPLILTNINQIKFELPKLSYKFIFGILIFFFIVYLFDFTSSYEITNSGGGFFYNLSNLLFDNDFFLLILCFFTYLYLLEIFRLNISNLVLFLSLILSHPQMTIWQANFSPTILFLLLLLLKDVISKNNLNLKTLIFSYFYFSVYLISNIVFRNILTL